MATTESHDPAKVTRSQDDVLAEKTAELSVSVPNNSAEEKEPSQAEKSTEAKATLVTTKPEDGSVLKPFPYPLPTCKPTPHEELKPEESKKYDELLDIVKGWTEVATKSATNSPKEALNDQDRLFLTRDCLLRYLRATKWDVAAAGKRLMATLTWRREYGLLQFTHDYISPENETGKQVILGYDNEARPCLYLNPSKQNTDRTPRQLQHLFYNMERVIDLMGPGQESLALLINFMDTRRGQGASIAQARETMYVLQNHYPERLGRALITELPWYITTFFKLISPFIDPITRTKLKFNEPMANYVPAEQLLTPFGGKVEFEYEHDVYWPALDELCTIRRNDYYDRWVKAGKQIGENEAYLRGGDAKCLNGTFSGIDFKEGFTKNQLEVSS